jgi:hypothetical protein
MGVGKNSQKSSRQARRGGIRRRLRLERLTERRVLATITGMVFEDTNLSFRQDADEVGLGNRLLYLDLNQNGLIEHDEPFALGREDGSFEFSDVPDGTHQLRLYNGTDSQQQSFPIQTVGSGQVVKLRGGISLATANNAAVALTDQGIEIADFANGQSQSISVGTNLTNMQALPDGNLIVSGGPADEATAWLVNASAQTVTPIDLSGDGNPTLWSQIAIDGDGFGIALGQGSDEVVIRAVDASNTSTGMGVTATHQAVPADTQVLTSATGSRSVLAWPGSDGLNVTTWSNSTASWINSTPIHLPDSSALLAFDDASGLLVTRSEAGGVTVHDADANFANLKTLPEVTGPVALDGEHDLLLALSEANSVQLYDVRDGEMIADLAIDLNELGTVSSLQYDGSQRSLVVLGSLGMAEYSFVPAAHRITIENREDPNPVSFGVTLDGDNVAPRYQSIPALETNEDTRLVKLAPGVLAGAIDDDGDSFVVVLTSPPANGTAVIQTNGGLDYQPVADFFGSDKFSVFVHDGRDSSGVIPLQILVKPTPDKPDGIDIDIDAIPENALPGFDLGPINIIDVDLNNNHIIQIGDARFGMQNGHLIFLEGELNHELEPWIEATITFRDPEFQDEIWTENIFIEVADAPDPITDITPDEASVHENQAGAPIAELTVWDEDVDARATLTVDDDRFIMSGKELRLADGVALDYEAAPEFYVNVTATDGDSFTKQIKINVLDLPEPVATVDLTEKSVMEFSPGHHVGDVLINGQAAQDSYDVYVSDQRFEIVGSQLKLIDDQWVERTTQQEIQLTITAQDTKNVFAPLSQTFVVEVIENPSPYHNDDSPFDVDGNGIISAKDALLIINYLNIYGPGPVGSGDPGFGYDVNGDGFVTALDALLILNQLNIQNIKDGDTVGGEKEKPEGEQTQPKSITPQQPQDLILPQRIASEDEYPAPVDQGMITETPVATNQPTSSSPLSAQQQPEALLLRSSDADDEETASSVDEALGSLFGSSRLR